MVHHIGGGIIMAEKKKLFSADRWNEPLGLKKIGQKNYTDEERKKNRKEAVKALRSLGIKASEDSPGWEE